MSALTPTSSLSASFDTRPRVGARGDSDQLALDLRNVTKVYKGGLFRKKVTALRGITMQVQRGAVFGLLGPNGAGKSTLVKIMLTVIRPTTCEGTMLGDSVGTKSTLRKVGYLPEHHRFPEYLSAQQVLDYFGALSEVDRATRKRRSAELLELVGLKDWSRSKVKGFSKGMRQRLGIANALMSDPDLVVLDEPTDGVDPVGRRDIREVLMRLRDQGKTVFLNSHLLSELEMVCDRVAILVQGVVSSQGTIDELTKDSRRYEIEVEGDVERLPALDRVVPASLPGSPSVTIHRGTITLNTDDPAAAQPVIDALRASQIAIKAVRPMRASLEDLFMRAVTDPTTGEVLAPGAKGGGDGARKKGVARS